MAAALLALVATGCTGDAEPRGAAPSDPSTPLEKYDTAGLALARQPFCARISATGVVAALDGTAEDAETWDNGDPTTVAPGVKDVAHEYGCRYTREGAEAAAWLFAPPVTPRRAATLARRARTTEGCREAPDAPAFGRPSAALVCEGAASAATASYRGLFGDAWLTCTLTRAGAPQEDLVAAAGRWCVEVAEAARVR